MKVVIAYEMVGGRLSTTEHDFSSMLSSDRALAIAKVWGSQRPFVTKLWLREISDTLDVDNIDHFNYSVIRGVDF